MHTISDLRPREDGCPLPPTCDRSRRCPAAELWLRPDDRHTLGLNSAEAALEWLSEQAGQR